MLFVLLPLFFATLSTRLRFLNHAYKSGDSSRLKAESFMLFVVLLVMAVLVYLIRLKP